MSTSATASRISGIAGIASIGLGVVAGAIDRMWEIPGTTATASEIAAYTHDHRTVLFWAMVMNTTAVVLWLVFGVGVWLRLRPCGGVDAGEEGFLSACFGVGLVTFVTLLLAGFTAMMILVYRTTDAASDARLLYDLTFGLLAMSGPPTALALGAYGLLVLRSGRLPRWTAWLALLAAVTHVLLLASFVVRDGFFSLEGAVIIVIPATLFAWIVGTSTVLLRRPVAAP